MLSILIVNWNTRDLAVRCVDSVIRSAEDLDFEAIVVDNASSDGSYAALRERFGANSRIKLISSRQNLGFAKANNLAFRSSSGEYIFLLNPDAEILPGSLKKLVKFLETDTDIGVAGPKIIDPEGGVQKSVRRFPDIWSSLVILLGLHRIFPPKNYLMNGFDYNREQEVDQVMGAAMLTRRSLIEKIGFLDEGFWLWYEEVDFCKRVKQAGYKVVYYPEAEIMHYAGKSFVQMPAYERKKIMSRSLVHYFRKHGNWFDIFLIKLTAPIVLGLIWAAEGIEGILGLKHRIKI